MLEPFPCSNIQNEHVSLIFVNIAYPDCLDSLNTTKFHCFQIQTVRIANVCALLVHALVSQ